MGDSDFSISGAELFKEIRKLNESIGNLRIDMSRNNEAVKNLTDRMDKVEKWDSWENKQKLTTAQKVKFTLAAAALAGFFSFASALAVDLFTK